MSTSNKVQLDSDTQKKIDTLALQPEVISESDKVIAVIESSNGGPSLSMELDKIGAESIRRAAGTNEHMQTAVNDALPSLAQDSPLAKLLNDATIMTTELNPNYVKKNWLYKIPFPALRRYVMRGYVEKFQSESGKVTTIFDNLRGGKEALLLKMIELESQYQSLMATYGQVERDMAIAYVTQEKLDAMDISDADMQTKQKYEKAQNKVARKLRDLATIKTAIFQFFISIDQTFNVQEQLSQSIDSLLQVGPVVLNNAIMINSAITQQQQIAKQVERTQGALSEAMLENAKLVEDNAETVADLYNNPVLAMDKLEESYTRLENAVNKTREAQRNATVASREMTTKLESMNDKFKGLVMQTGDDMSSSESLAQA